ncbi:MAG TPA: hypothetical protein VMS17_16100 [Gemmataceae bacterium]|nr:hypothetical protein [Gemmataceae bacterium]
MPNRTCCIVVGVVILAGSAGTAQGQSDGAARLQGVVDQAANELQAVRSRLDAGARNQLDSRLAAVRDSKSAVDRLLMDLESKRSQVRSEKEQAEVLRLDAEAATKRHDDYSNWYDQEGKRFADRFADHNRRTEAHNARQDQPMTDEEAEAYNEEARRGNAEGEALQKEYEQFITENGKQLLDLSLEASKIEQEYQDAQSRVGSLEQEESNLAADANSKIAAASDEADGLRAVLADSRKAADAASTVRGAPAHRSVEEARAVPPPANYAPEARASDKVRSEVLIIPAHGDDARTGELADQIRLGGAVKDLDKYTTQPAASRPAPAPVDAARLPEHPVSHPASAPAADVIAVHRAVDPGRYFTKADHDRAAKEGDRLRSLKKKLEDKLADLDRWQEGDERYLEEVADIKKELAREELGHILAMAQIGTIAKSLADAEKLRKVLPPETAEKISKAVTPELAAALEKAEKALNAAFNSREAGDAQTEAQRFEAATGAVSSAREALQKALYELPENSPAAKWLDGVGKTLEIGGKVLSWTMEDERKNGPEPGCAARLAELGDKTTQIVGVFVPPISMLRAEGQLIGGEAVDPYAERALENLSFALSKNAEARANLHDRLDRINEWIAEQDRIAATYETTHNRNPRSLRP